MNAIVANVSMTRPNDYMNKHKRLRPAHTVTVSGDASDVSIYYVAFSVEGPDGTPEQAVEVMKEKYIGDWQFSHTPPPAN